MSGFRNSDNGRVLIPYGTTKKIIRGILPGEHADDAVTKAQLDNIDNTLLAANNAFTGNNTHSGTETFSNAAGVTTNTITERTAASGVTADSVLLKDGGVTVTTGVLQGSLFAGFFPTAAQQNITAGTGGAVNVTSYLTTINTDAGGDAFTLAAGSVGQLKKIQLVADGGGDGTLTLTGYTSIVFNDANDYVILMWNGSAWFVLENSGCTVNA